MVVCVHREIQGKERLVKENQATAFRKNEEKAGDANWGTGGKKQHCRQSKEKVKAGHNEMKIWPL